MITRLFAINVCKLTMTWLWVSPEVKFTDTTMSSQFSLSQAVPFIFAVVCDGDKP